jgi:hypothetical protein
LNNNASGKSGAVQNYADQERRTLGLIELKSGEKLSRRPQFGANPPSLAENAVVRFPPICDIGKRASPIRPMMELAYSPMPPASSAGNPSTPISRIRATGGGGGFGPAFASPL